MRIASSHTNKQKKINAQKGNTFRLFMATLEFLLTHSGFTHCQFALHKTPTTSFLSLYNNTSYKSHNHQSHIIEVPAHLKTLIYGILQEILTAPIAAGQIAVVLK